MGPHHIKSFLIHTVPSGVLFIILMVGLSYEYLEISSLRKELQALRESQASSTALLYRQNDEFNQKLAELYGQTLGITTTLSTTQQNIDAVKNQVGGVEQTVGSISGTVGTLQKLAQVDPQILKKYSKVYFTNENYAPAHLITLPSDYTYSSARTEQVVTEVSPYLTRMINDAKKDGVTLFVKSSYRSFAEQKSLKSKYSIIYGAGTANSFSADQGYSEHQLGTTVDFITNGLNGQLVGFDKTPSYEWLLKNAYRYGFILSYPKGNTFYIYEPWHWRFVGVKLATFLHDANINFYDMDQRDIDKYLANVFD